MTHSPVKESYSFSRSLETLAFIAPDLWLPAASVCRNAYTRYLFTMQTIWNSASLKYDGFSFYGSCRFHNHKHSVAENTLCVGLRIAFSRCHKNNFGKKHADSEKVTYTYDFKNHYAYCNQNFSKFVHATWRQKLLGTAVCVTKKTYAMCVYAHHRIATVLSVHASRGSHIDNAVRVDVGEQY